MHMYVNMMQNVFINHVKILEFLNVKYWYVVTNGVNYVEI